MRLSDENLRGRTVISADGQAIGRISSLAIDVDAWRIEAICVELRKEIADRIGTRRTLFRRGELEIPARMVQSIGDAIILSADVDELREVQLPARPGSGAHPS
jgi:sporulation protein YlmC with PRC-barrel domain